MVRLARVPRSWRWFIFRSKKTLPQPLPVRGGVDRKNTMGYKTASPDRYELLKAFARENRKNATVAEDILREQDLEKMGYHVIRFTNDDVLYDIDNVIEQIENYFNE